MNDLDLKCIMLDAEMEMARVGEECIKKNPDATDPCGLCQHYGFCFRKPSEKLNTKEDGDTDA